MKMGAQFVMRKKLVQRFIKTLRFDGRNAYPEISIHIKDFFKQCREMHSLMLITADVYTGQHDFFISKVKHFSYILQNIFSASADCPSSYHGNDAERTEIIAAVLYFNHASGMKAL